MKKLRSFVPDPQVIGASDGRCHDIKSPYSLYIKEGGAFVRLNTDIEVTMPRNYTGVVCTSPFAAKCGFSVETRSLAANSITILTLNIRMRDKMAGTLVASESIALLTLDEHIPIHTKDHGFTYDQALVSRAESKPGRRLSANDIAKNLMADTLALDRPLNDNDVKEVLDAWEFNKNADRKCDAR